MPSELNKLVEGIFGELNPPLVLDLSIITFNRKNDKPIIGIYKITSPSGKIYIGQSLNIENRITKAYKRLGCKSQYKIFSSLNKYGAENHIFELIYISKESDFIILDEIERKYIQLFNTFDTEHGLNLTNGGDSGRLASEETKKRMSIANKGRFVSEETKDKIRKAQTGRKHTEEHRQKNRDARIGDKNHFYGKTHTEETRNKSSEWHKANQSGENHPFFGKHHSDESKEKISLARIGHKNTEEQNKRQSERVSGAGNPMYGSHRYGEENPMFGKKHSDETKKKIGDKNRGREISEDERKKRGESQKGRKHSEETKRKISESRKSKNIVVSDETKKK